MSTTTEDKPVWIGTAEVRPKAGNSLLGGGSGAFVAAVGLADSAPGFHAAVERALGALDFDVISIEDVRLLNTKNELGTLDHALRGRVEGLSKRNPVELGTFHAYSNS